MWSSFIQLSSFVIADFSFKLKSQLVQHNFSFLVTTTLVNMFVGWPFPWSSQVSSLLYLAALIWSGTWHERILLSLKTSGSSLHFDFHCAVLVLLGLCQAMWETLLARSSLCLLTLLQYTLLQLLRAWQLFKVVISSLLSHLPLKYIAGSCSYKVDITT